MCRARKGTQSQSRRAGRRVDAVSLVFLRSLLFVALCKRTMKKSGQDAATEAQLSLGDLVADIALLGKGDTREQSPTQFGDGVGCLLSAFGETLGVTSSNSKDEQNQKHTFSVPEGLSVDPAVDDMAQNYTPAAKTSFRRPHNSSRVDGSPSFRETIESFLEISERVKGRDGERKRGSPLLRDHAASPVDELSKQIADIQAQMDRWQSTLKATVDGMGV